MNRAFFVNDRLVTPAKFGGRYSMRYVDDREDAGPRAVIRATELAPVDIARQLHPDFDPGRDLDVTGWATAILQEVVAFDSWPDGTRVRVQPHGRLVAETDDLEVARAEGCGWAERIRRELGGLPVYVHKRDEGWCPFSMFHWPPSWGPDGKPPTVVDLDALVAELRRVHAAVLGPFDRAVLA